MDIIIALMIFIIVLLSIIFIMVNFRFLYKCFNEIIDKVRDIAKAENLGGYLKLIQIIFVVPLIILFVLTFVYFWVSKDKVSPIGIVFTVIVGWLGFILARFFGEEAMETTTKQKENVEEMQEIIDDYEDRVNESEEIIEEYSEKIEHLLDYVNYLKSKNKSRRK